MPVCENIWENLTVDHLERMNLKEYVIYFHHQKVANPHTGWESSCRALESLRKLNMIQMLRKVSMVFKRFPIF